MESEDNTGGWRRPGRWMKAALPLLLLAAGVAGAAALALTRPRVEPRPQAERSWAVRVMEARPGTYQPSLHHFGEVRAGRQTPLAMAVGGEVLWISPSLVDGGRVKKGEPLLRLDDFDYRTTLREIDAQLREAEARLAELEAERVAAEDLAGLLQEQLALAEREVERQHKLRKRSVATQKTLDNALMVRATHRVAVRENASKLAMLRQRIEQQRAVIERLREERRRAERDLAETELRAPFDAIVEKVDVGVGRELKPHEPIATLIETASLEIEFTLTDAEFGRLWKDGLIGRKVEALWKLPEQSFRIQGRVARLASRIEASMGGVRLRASILHLSDRVPLRPGAFLEVAVPDLTYRDVVRLPHTALQEDGRVYVVEKGRMQPRSVEIVARDGAFLLVRAGDLAGARVVISRLPESGPGLKVEIVS